MLLLPAIGQGQQPGSGWTGWTNQDIGTVGVVDWVSYAAASDTFTVNGSGSDIWGNADSFHFVHQSMSGDGVLIVRVSSQDNIDPWAKAGLMIRDSIDPAAPEASLALTPGNSITFR